MESQGRAGIGVPLGRIRSGIPRESRDWGSPGRAGIGVPMERIRKGIPRESRDWGSHGENEEWNPKGKQGLGFPWESREWDSPGEKKEWNPKGEQGLEFPWEEGMESQGRAGNGIPRESRGWDSPGKNKERNPHGEPIVFHPAGISAAAGTAQPAVLPLLAVPRRYYLFALVVNLSRDAYEIRLLLERAEAARRRGKSPESRAQPQAEGRGQQLRLQLQLQLQLLLQVLRDNPPVLLDLLKNACDLLIPLEKLGLCRSSPAVLGFCGLTSSVLSIITILHPWLKLKP
uniref:Peroxisomal membrane protein 11B n=1 Tax=Serinus canaria TaxID=9135 RepID=A0A8C9L346_SERCA